MKKILFAWCFAALGSWAGPAMAQHPYIAPLGLTESPSGATYSMPATVLNVEMILQKEVIRSGPYARYAQKYLGVMAPLADKDIYSVISARIGYSDGMSAPSVQAAPAKKPGKPGADFHPGAMRFDDRGVEPVISERTVMSHTASDTSFVRVTPDRTETVEKSPEDMARSAAGTIFSIRKKRLDLVTGDAGENVFGAGLQAAIDELARIENEYLALFLGKQYVQQTVRCFTVVPDKNKTSYIVCRFSENTGLMSESDLAGRPILLELRPDGRTKSGLPERGAKDTRPGHMFRVADYVNCRVLDGKTELTSQRIPIYQFGATIDVPGSGK